MKPAALMLVAALPILAFRCADEKASASQQRFVPVRGVTQAREITTTGKVVPEVGSEVKIAPRISGTLVRLHARVGDFVRCGDVIAEIDRGTLSAELARAEASLASANADERYALTVLTRKRTLREQGLVSHEDVDVVERDWQRAVANRRAATAARDAAVVQLGYTKLSSPISGVIASVSTQEGETVAASFAAPTFVTIVDVEKLKLIAYLDELDVSAVRAEQPATFTVDALGGETFSGVVRSVNPQAVVRDNVTNYVANIEIRGGSGGSLRPDMSANVVIATGQQLHVLVIPEGAIRRDESGQTFVDVKRGDRAVRQRVQLGDRAAQGVIVREGLVATDLVALSGQGAPQ